MGLRREYSIKFAGLKNGEYHFDFHLDDTFFAQYEDSPIQHGNIDVGVYFEKRPYHFKLGFNIRGTITAECDKCLGEFNLPIEGNCNMYVKFYPHNMEKPEEQIDVVYLADCEIKLDLSQYLYEYANLSVPLKKNHPENKNQQPSCNPRILELIEQHKRQNTNQKVGPTDPRWKALEKFKTE